MFYTVKKFVILAFASAFLVSCTCGVPLKVTPIQGDDKKLACKDVILEINESEHYRNQAAKEKAIGFNEMFMPMCWVSGYVDGAQAIKAANARIDYLGRIYDLLDCGGKELSESKLPPPPPPPVTMQAPAVGFGSGAPFSRPMSIESPDSHYRSVDDSDVESKMHEHRDKNGKIYIHSHPHSGPHRHFEDY